MLPRSYPHRKYMALWSETSYSGDERRCYRCGTNDERTLKIELLSRWKLEAQFRNINCCFQTFHCSTVKICCSGLCLSFHPPPSPRKLRTSTASKFKSNLLSLHSSHDELDYLRYVATYWYRNHLDYPYHKPPPVLHSYASRIC